MTTSKILFPTIRRSYQTSVIYWCDAHGKKVDTEVHIRSTEGLFYHVDYGSGGNRGAEYLYNETYRRGIHSRRPYTLWQTADHSTRNCVLALVSNLLEYQGIDAQEFFQQAVEPAERRLLPYGDREIQAGWERVEYPHAWGKKEIDALKKSLTDFLLHCTVRALDSQVSV